MQPEKQVGKQPQRLTRNVVEYAFSDLRRLSITRDQKIQIKNTLRLERNGELGRKLKKQVNRLFSAYQDKDAFVAYLNQRKAYDNAVITMIILLAGSSTNELLKQLSSECGPFSPKQIEEILARPKIKDANRRLVDFVKNHKDNILLHLPSGNRIHVKKEARENERTLYWSADVLDRSQWLKDNVETVIISYPRNYDIEKFKSSNYHFRNAVENFGPVLFYTEGTNDTIDVYFVHEMDVSHSRYLVDGRGLSIIFEVRKIHARLTP